MSDSTSASPNRIGVTWQPFCKPCSRQDRLAGPQYERGLHPVSHVRDRPCSEGGRDERTLCDFRQRSHHGDLLLQLNRIFAALCGRLHLVAKVESHVRSDIGNSLARYFWSRCHTRGHGNGIWAARGERRHGVRQRAARGYDLDLAAGASSFHWEITASSEVRGSDVRFPESRLRGRHTVSLALGFIFMADMRVSRWTIA